MMLHCHNCNIFVEQMLLMKVVVSNFRAEVMVVRSFSCSLQDCANSTRMAAKSHWDTCQHLVVISSKLISDTYHR